MDVCLCLFCFVWLFLPWQCAVCQRVCAAEALLLACDASMHLQRMPPPAPAEPGTGRRCALHVPCPHQLHPRCCPARPSGCTPLSPRDAPAAALPGPSSCTLGCCPVALLLPYRCCPCRRRELAEESGIQHWGRVPALNTNATFIDDLADAVTEALPYVSSLARSSASLGASLSADSLVPLGECWRCCTRPPRQPCTPMHTIGHAPRTSKHPTNPHPAVGRLFRFGAHAATRQRQGAHCILFGCFVIASCWWEPRVLLLSLHGLWALVQGMPSQLCCKPELLH